MSPLVLAAALAATPVSHSKLGVVVLADDATSRALLGACPALVVFPVPANPTAPAQLAAYHESCAGGIAIVRVGEAGAAVDGDTVARLGPGWLRELAGMWPDAVEGPSEPTGSPSELAEFWSAFADLIENANLRPVVGALPADMPGVGAPRTDPFCPTADLMHRKPYMWWWSYHARSPMTADLASEATPTLGYRRIAADCGLTGVTVVVSEAGPVTVGALRRGLARLARRAPRRGRRRARPGAVGGRHERCGQPRPGRGGAGGPAREPLRRAVTATTAGAGGSFTAHVH
jgi:hypothetical protein